MNIEAHGRALRESLEIIKESIQRGVEDRQRTIGFHCSVAAADMLELYLHSRDMIDPGETIKHDSFTSERKAAEKLKMDFPEKQKTIKLLVELEGKRNLLCYGKPQAKEFIMEYISTFNKLRKIFEKAGLHYE